jgi:hypothetical protein
MTKCLVQRPKPLFFGKFALGLPPHLLCAHEIPNRFCVRRDVLLGVGGSALLKQGESKRF